MATSTSLAQNRGPEYIIRPRPVKASNPMVLRAQSEDGSHKPNGNADSQLSGNSRYRFPTGCDHRSVLT